MVKELAARSCLLRGPAHPRGRGASGPLRGRRGAGVRVGPLEVRPDEGVVRRDGRQVELTRTEFHLLCEMAENAGLVLSREKLLERVWGYDYFGDARLVDAHIRRLRTKIEDDPSHPTLIVTVRGLGYKLHR